MSIIPPDARDAATFTPDAEATFLLKHVAENHPDVSSGSGLAGAAQRGGIEPPDGIDLDRWHEIASEVVNGER